MSTVTPEIERKRLKVLWQYEVLDTVPEALFDDLTELAACICEAPIALVSLVDEKRQWFKSKFGTTLKETSRDISFCSHAIEQPDLFIIPDATKDSRFANNPLVVSDPRIRFYAGAPLIAPDGYAVGTLCIIDKVPRELRSEQKQALRILARHIVSQLELRRRAREIQEGKSARQSTGEPAPAKSELPGTHLKRPKKSEAKSRASKSASKRLLRSPRPKAKR
jgi:GAF domain-containing protein